MHARLARAAVLGTLGLVTPARATPITLDDALARAAHRPSVELAALDLEAARAVARSASRPLANPELAASAGPQFGSGSPSPQIQISLATPIERGGKRAARVGVAAALVRTAESAGTSESIRARIDVRRAFERAVIARERLVVRTALAAGATELADAQRRALAAGGAPPLRVSVALAAAGRATAERLAAASEYATATAALGTAVGAAPDEELEPVGSLAPWPVLSPAGAAPMHARDADRPPVVRAAEQAVVLAQARVTEADARGVVDVTMGVTYAYETDERGAHSVVGTVSVPLAVRTRNQGERAAARVGAQRAAVELAAVRSEAARSARVAADAYARAVTAVVTFDRKVIEHLDANLSAAREAFAAGGLTYVELVTTQHELADARLAYLDARLAAVEASAALALATGTDIGGAP